MVEGPHMEAILDPGAIPVFNVFGEGDFVEWVQGIEVGLVHTQFGCEFAFDFEKLADKPTATGLLYFDCGFLFLAEVEYAIYQVDFCAWNTELELTGNIF